MKDEWVEVASVPLPDSMAVLSDEALEALRIVIEEECAVEFLRLMDAE
jgi:hypothetical protein